LPAEWKNRQIQHFARNSAKYVSQKNTELAQNEFREKIQNSGQKFAEFASKFAGKIASAKSPEITTDNIILSVELVFYE